MPNEAKEVTRGKVTKARAFDQRDWDHIAEYVCDELKRRKNKRREKELHWKEVDRQLAMTPDNEFKYVIKDGKRVVDRNKAWMAEMELPLQAQALEVLTADARRMMFSDADSWFRAHSQLTDEYLDRVDFTSLVAGDENEVPSVINQDNADKLVEGFLNHFHDQGDFFARHDRINAEAFKYGMGVGRARLDMKSVYIHTARGVLSEKKKIPVIIPASIKNTYLDDRPPSAHSAQVLGEAHIYCEQIKLENLAMAANKGSKDPDDPDGGWMPAQLKKVEANDNGYVEIAEMEGDLVIPRKTVRSMVIPGAIVTVAIGTEGKICVVRFRWRKYPFSSYILYPYHYEHIDDPYPTSPLMKGRPVQMMATDAFNRLTDAGMLKNGPPVGYDRNDMVFAREGGPAIFPNAQWGTTDKVEVYNEIGGDQGTLASVMAQAINLYAELTGILPARLGAQTVSHTTAFAKDAELSRGAVRTVDYVKQCGKGALERWLDMAYIMGLDAFGKNETISFYIPAYGGFVEIDKDKLPDKASFEWFGSGGPAEEQAIQQARLASLNMAMQMDQLAIATGNQPTVNIQAAIREVLREGKWTDVDAIVSGTAANNQASPGIAGTAGPDGGLASTALQAIAFGGGGQAS